MMSVWSWWGEPVTTLPKEERRLALHFFMIIKNLQKGNCSYLVALRSFLIADNSLNVMRQAGLRIRINLSCWIRIQEGKNYPKK
jgi:hypothetical protein